MTTLLSLLPADFFSVLSCPPFKTTSISLSVNSNLAQKENLLSYR